MILLHTVRLTFIVCIRACTATHQYTRTQFSVQPKNCASTQQRGLPDNPEYNTESDVIAPDNGVPKHREQTRNHRDAQSTAEKHREQHRGQV